VNRLTPAPHLTLHDCRAKSTLGCTDHPHERRSRRPCRIPIVSINMAPVKRLPDGRDVAALRSDGTSRWVQSGTRFKCSRCDWNFAQEKKIKEHYAGTCADDSELLTCNLKETCNKRYLNLDDLARHEAVAKHDVTWFRDWTSLGGDKIRCKICGKEYPSRYRKQHEAAHQGESIVKIDHDTSHMILNDDVSFNRVSR
jgi:hypothetical protein